MTEIPKLISGNLEYLLLDPSDEEWHSLAAKRGYYACNPIAATDETDPNIYRSAAEVTLSNLGPKTGAESALLDNWRVQIFEWGAREYANHALHDALSAPTLRPNVPILGQSYDNARQPPSLAFRFGMDPDAFGYSRPAQGPDDQPVQELSIPSVAIEEYSETRCAVVRTLGNVAQKYGLHAYVARESLKISAYDEDGEPYYTDPHISFYSKIQAYKAAAAGLMQLSNSKEYADMHQEPVISGTQFQFAVMPWPRTRVRMHPGYFEYRVPGCFSPDNERPINFLREAIELGHSIDSEKVSKIPSCKDAVIVRPGKSFVRTQDQTLMDSMSFMVADEDGSVRVADFSEQDYDEIIGEIIGSDVDSRTTMRCLSQEGVLKVHNSKFQVDETKLPDFVSMLPASYRQRFIVNPQEIVAKINQRLSVFDVDIMPAVTVGRRFKQ